MSPERHSLLRDCNYYSEAAPLLVTRKRPLEGALTPEIEERDAGRNQPQPARDVRGAVSRVLPINVIATIRKQTAVYG